MSAVATYINTVNEASAAPDQDWSSQLSAVVADPLLSQIEDQLAENAKAGLKIVGPVTLDYSVPMAGPVEVEVVPGDQTKDHSTVTLSVCVDTTAQEFQRADGSVTKPKNVHGTYWRVPTTFKVAEFPSGWFVGFHDPNPQATC